MQGGPQVCIHPRKTFLFEKNMVGRYKYGTGQKKNNYPKRTKTNKMEG